MKCLYSLLIIMSLNVFAAEYVNTVHFFGHPKEYIGREIILSAFVKRSGDRFEVYLTKEFSELDTNPLNKFILVSKSKLKDVGIMEDCVDQYLTITGKPIINHDLFQIELTKDPYLKIKSKGIFKTCNLYQKETNKPKFDIYGNLIEN